jgi:hypothetical protein
MTASCKLSGCGDPHAPNKTECRGIWRLAFERCQALMRSRDAVKPAGRKVRAYLFARASFLAASQDSLLNAFKSKFAAWLQSGCQAQALRDGRKNNNARAYELPEGGRNALIHRAVFGYRGDIAAAWRDLLRQGFSPAVVERYAGRALKKSHVPASVMDSVSAAVKVLTVMHRGKRAFDAIKEYVTRSYEGIDSLQCISGDNFTLNTYFYIPYGHSWFQLTRGQVILFIDFRTLRILGWALDPRKSYSSLATRSLYTHVFSEFGVPEILYFSGAFGKTPPVPLPG